MVPNVFVEHFCLFENSPTNGGTSNKLWAIAMVQLCPIALDPRWGDDVTWNLIIAIPIWQLSLSPWGGEICPLCAKPQHRVMPTSSQRWKMRTATGIFKVTRSVFNSRRSWSCLARLLNRLCRPSHFVPAMKWSSWQVQSVSSLLNLKVARQSWIVWNSTILLDLLLKNRDVLCLTGKEVVVLFRKNLPNIILAYIDSSRSLKATIQKFSLEYKLHKQLVKQFFN